MAKLFALPVCGRLQFSVVVVLCALVLSPAATGRGQEAGFEAASVKVNPSGDRRRLIQTPPGRFNGTNVTLSLMMGFAYEVQRFRLVNGPSWLDSEGFDIVATLPVDPAAPTVVDPGRVRSALRRLLESRFKLAIHRETREMPIFALTLARPGGKPGPTLRPSTMDCSPGGVATRRAAVAAGTPPTGNCGAMFAGTRVQFGGRTMAELAAALSPVDNRLIVDRTNLGGTWDAELAYAPPGPPGQPADANLPEDFFTALQEQLGLKLEPARGPVDVVVIDNVQRPEPD